MITLAIIDCFTWEKCTENHGKIFLSKKSIKKIDNTCITIKLIEIEENTCSIHNFVNYWVKKMQAYKSTIEK